MLDKGEVVAAKVVETPWKKSWDASGEDVSFTLCTSRGDVSIAAETHLSTFQAAAPIREGVSFPPMQQGIARYRWGGEEAYGMIERSTRADLPAA